jgi:hypothetical protein
MIRDLDIISRSIKISRSASKNLIRGRNLCPTMGSYGMAHISIVGKSCASILAIAMQEERIVGSGTLYLPMIHKEVHSLMAALQYIGLLDVEFKGNQFRFPGITYSPSRAMESPTTLDSTMRQDDIILKVFAGVLVFGQVCPGV